MRNKIVAALVLAPLAALALSSCAGETAAPVTKKVSDTKVVHEAAETADEDDPEVDVTEAAPDTLPDETAGHAGGTASLGDTVEVGDWSVEVTEVARNANATIANANSFNDRPKGQYVLVTYEATYNGTEHTADASWDLTWSLTGNDNRIIENDGEVTPSDAEEWPTSARLGGTVKAQVVFDIDPNNLSGGILSVEAYDAHYDTVFADFKVQ
jgi:hypothetical protein